MLYAYFSLLTINYSLSTIHSVSQSLRLFVAKSLCQSLCSTLYALSSLLPDLQYYAY
jgi:hypothetical protein